MWEVLIHALLIVLLPMSFAAGLLRGRNRWEWWTNFSLTIAVTSWSFVVGRWDLVGYPVRFVIPILVLIAGLIGWRHVRRLGSALSRGSVRNLSVILNLVLSLVFLAQTGMGIAGHFSSQSAIELQFPLKEGVYYIIHGGSTVTVNYHAAYAPQAFALDVSRVHRFGRRSTGMYPSDPQEYAIFGVPVYSPCAGEVVGARDGMQDLSPPQRDPGSPEGNFVTVRCQGVDVVLAHMQQGSVMVREGDAVSVGQLLGRVGNSGNTSEPHLHMHAQRETRLPDGTTEWIGVPMRFSGRFLVRNDLVVVD